MKKIHVLSGAALALGLVAGSIGTETALKVHWLLSGTDNNGWAENLTYGRDDLGTLKRASNAVMAMGAHRAEHAIYTLGLKDADGDKLQPGAAYKITVHGKAPHSEMGFFSITSYNGNYPLPLVDNPLGKYAINNANMIEVSDYSENGFSFIYSPVKPDSVAEQDWLPASPEKPLPILRIYHPEQSVLDGEYKMPTIEKYEE